MPPAASSPAAPHPKPTPDGVSRRAWLQGLGLTASGLGAASAATPSAVGGPQDLSSRTGLQGQTDALRQPAHAALREGHAFATEARADPDVEDLVVVGAGISGLAGAWWFRQHAGRPVRILLLDALDDVGGHARRNTFTARNGQRLVGYGGSQSLDTPGLFSPAVHALLQGVGIELKRFETEIFDRSWSARHGVSGRAMFFDRREWGRDRLVRPQRQETPAAWLARTPLARAAQTDLARLLRTPRNVLPSLRTRAARRDHLAQITYRDFLLKHWRVHPQVARFYQHDTQAYFGVGIDATTALDAWAAGLPGFQGLDLGEAIDPRLSPSGRQIFAGQDPYIYHFPDGNHGVARALLRALIPAALPGEGMAGLVDTPLGVTQLDRPDAPVRLRLQATVLGLRHLGPPGTAESVELRYADATGQLRSVRTRQVLLACWHRVIPRLTNELSADQVAALNDQVKVPLVYANVLLSNWRAFQRIGAGRIEAVQGFWGEAALDFPVHLGSVKPPERADQPVLLHLGKVVLPHDPAALGQPARAQATAGRALLETWSLTDFEAEIRRLLHGALGAHGLDVHRHIEAITVNRWAHGYAYEYMRPWDLAWPDGPLPCERARRPWGRVAIANSDAGAFAYAHSAIDQAARAVKELLPEAPLPRWNDGPGPAPGSLGLPA